MVVRSTLLVSLTFLGVCFVPRAHGQETEPTPGRRGPSLSERLEQFRQDMTPASKAASRRPPAPTPAVDSDESIEVEASAEVAASSDSFGAGRKMTGPSRATKSAPTPAVVPERRPTASTPSKPAAPTVVVPQEEPQPSAASNQPAGARPRLEVQSARRAQGAGGSAATSSARAARPAVEKPAAPQEEAKPLPASSRTSSAKAKEPKESKVSEASEVVDKPRVARAEPAPVDPPKSRDTRSAVLTPTSSTKTHAGDTVLFSGQSPALSVEAVGPKKVMIGKEAQFAVKIKNSGAPANNVVVTVNIPNYVELASVQASDGAVEAPSASDRGEPLEWKIERLEAATSETMTLKIVPRKSTPLDLAVRWTYTPEASQTFVEVQEPKLAMNVSGPDEILFGQSKIYKLTVSNPGNGDTENITVGLLPIGRSSDGITNHRVGTLKAGESKTIEIELTARQAGALMIKAQAFADGGLRAEAAEQVLVRRANLRIEVEAPKIKYAGTVGNYRVKVVNAGNATAEAVQVAAMLPPESKYVTSSGGGRLEAQQGKVTWNVGTLQPGAERSFEMQCSLSTPGENRMQFLSVADGDLSTAASSSTRVEALADLKLEIKDPQGPIALGDDTVYEVQIRNRGTKAAEAIDLTIYFSEGLEATQVEGGSHEIGSGQVAFKPISMLGAGESVVYRVHAKADRSGNHVFRAEVLCQSLNTKLAAEETTHFYGEDRAAGDEPRTTIEPTPARPRDPEPLPAEPGEVESLEAAPDESNP